MKRLTFVTSLALVLSSACSDQSVGLVGSTVALATQIERGQIYSPDCQITGKHLAFIDSLVNSLIKNRTLKLTIEFYGDGYESDEFEKQCQIICGQKRLASLFTYHYPELDQKRIEYIFNGNKDAVYTSNQIFQMNDVEKINAYRRNRRTVFRIVEVDFNGS